MSIFNRKKNKPQVETIPPMPTWEEIVRHLQHEPFDPGWSGEVARVIYAKDGAKRIAIIRSEKGFYRAVCEEIRVYDEDDWVHFTKDSTVYPAWWEPVYLPCNSFYGSEEEALRETMLSCPSLAMEFDAGTV